jgi:hypothetical protein
MTVLGAKCLAVRVTGTEALNDRTIGVAMRAEALAVRSAIALDLATEVFIMYLLYFQIQSSCGIKLE